MAEKKSDSTSSKPPLETQKSSAVKNEKTPPTQEAAPTANEDAGEENPRKIKIWNSRSSYVKKGQQYAREQSFTEAARNFEKYIRILEIYFGCKSGELNPELFKQNFKTAELSVVAGVYWELVKIYDYTPNNFERQVKYVKKLTEFSPLTPINSEIIKHALAFEEHSQNPQNIRSFIDSADSSQKGFLGKLIKKIK